MNIGSKVVITGASGFVGSYLVPHLKKQGKGVKCFTGDVRYLIDLRKVLSSQTKAVVNLACRQPATEQRYAPRQYFEINVEGLINILDVCRETGIPRVISIMSYLHTLEETKCLFSISEEAAVDCLLYYNKHYGMSNIIIRVPSIIGWGSHLIFYKNGKLIKSGLLTFTEKAQAGETIEIWGDAGTPRYILYVRDLVSLIDKLIDSNFKGTLYPASDFVSLDEEVKAIISIFSTTEKKSKITYKLEISNSIKQYPAPFNRKYEGVCNWRSSYNLESMLVDIKKEMELGKYSKS